MKCIRWYAQAEDEFGKWTGLGLKREVSLGLVRKACAGSHTPTFRGMFPCLSWGTVHRVGNLLVLALLFDFTSFL